MADYPAVIPASTASGQGTTDVHSVRGTVVEGLTKEDMWRLDLFEGDEYERRGVRVKILSMNEGNEVPDPCTNGASTINEHVVGSPESRSRQQPQQEDLEAETYIWIAGEHLLDDDEWDYDEFVREKLWRWAPAETAQKPKDEDTGFDDVRRAVEERDQDPTGGRTFGGSFEKAVQHDGVAAEKVMESAV